MPGLQASTAIQADGSVMMRWSPLQPATGYAAWAFGGMDRAAETAATSCGGRAARRASSAAGLWDWLPPSVVANLVAKKIVMPPSQTSCQIPAEVKKASGEMMVGNLNAFGPEANFSYPPKPAGNAVWNIDWTAKVRFRSHTMLLSVPISAGWAVQAEVAEARLPSPRKRRSAKVRSAFRFPTC